MYVIITIKFVCENLPRAATACYVRRMHPGSYTLKQMLTSSVASIFIRYAQGNSWTCNCVCNFTAQSNGTVYNIYLTYLCQVLAFVNCTRTLCLKIGKSFPGDYVIMRWILHLAI